ncbi:MAG TPA: hypothetical protein VHA30_05005 [Patescibacteria group bacterium]|nr:hypothetical protein [Patescibacteria group bacterium]
MKFSEKIASFLLVFSAVFYWVHVSGHYNTKVILADLGGLPWLYTSLVTLFSIITGFIIQKEWDNWNSLLDSVKGEVDALRELWLWSRHLPEDYKARFDSAIKKYLEEMASDGLNKSERQERSREIEQAFSTIQGTMFEMSQSDSRLMPTTFSFFIKLIEYRTSRIRYTSHHVPQSLQRTLLFTTFLIIALSLFIGIKDIWLDYTFTLSVALMAFIIYLVVDDLDHPLVRGSWHLTPADYEALLRQISADRTGH